MRPSSQWADAPNDQEWDQRTGLRSWPYLAVYDADKVLMETYDASWNKFRGTWQSMKEKVESENGRLPTRDEARAWCVTYQKGIVNKALTSTQDDHDPVSQKRQQWVAVTNSEGPDGGKDFILLGHENDCLDLCCQTYSEVFGRDNWPYFGNQIQNPFNKLTTPIFIPHEWGVNEKDPAWDYVEWSTSLDNWAYLCCRR